MSFADGLKTIVVAIDQDGKPQAALEYARKLAGAYHARVVLAYGLDPLDYVSVEGLPGRVLRRMTQAARASLEEMAADLIWEGIHSHSVVRQGSVSQMLVDIATQYEAGLIVVGTKGREGSGPVMVGAIAEQVVRAAPCAVLAVAEDWNAGDFRPSPGGPVLLAIERNEASSDAVDAACSLAESFHRTLLVLHARRPAEAAALLNPRSTALAHFGIDSHRSFPVHCIVQDGNPADVIEEVIADYHPCVLVAGVKRTSGKSGPHGTAFEMLACSRVPVMCVPPVTVAAGEAPGKAYAFAVA
jgi:nucleotide-binding universal stress UspA family protein